MKVKEKRSKENLGEKNTVVLGKKVPRTSGDVTLFGSGLNSTVVVLNSINECGRRNYIKGDLIKS